MKKFIIILLLIFSGCKDDSDPIAIALESDKLEIKRVVNSLSKYKVQILYTEIERGKSGTVNFKDYSYRVDDSSYFYPASTVKFPIALLALEKLNEDKAINRDTRFYIEGDSVITTFSEEVEKIFVVSGNQAYNRLFEYLGQDDINERLNAKGLTARISHRLSTRDSENVTTKPLVVYLNDSTTTTSGEIINDPVKRLPLTDVLKGIGYVENDSLIKEPKNFSTRNYLPLTSLHNIMKQFIFSELYTKEKQFHISEDDREFVLKTMKTLPNEAGYTSSEYYDSYVKFLVFGDSKESIPEHIEIYNKVGLAYGYLTDCAYIIDKTSKKEWIITATIYVNNNEIFNDNVYEYDSIGIPFLAELGRQLIKF